MIKTVHLTNAYHASSGGIRTFYRALMAAAADHGRQVRLIVPGEETAIEDVNPFARIYHVRAPRSPFIDRRYRLILPHRFVTNRRGVIWRILRAEEPDLIEVCDKYSLCYVAGLVRRGWLSEGQRPTLVGLTCERMDDNVAAFLTRAHEGREFAKWYMRSVYVPQFDGHIAVSRYTADEVQTGVRPVYIAPMGVDYPYFVNRRSIEARDDLFRSALRYPQPVVLLYVGRLSAEKNIPLLVDVMGILATRVDRQYHLYIAGDGPLREWMEDESRRRAPGRVHMLGHVSDRERIAALYANADVLVHPNPREPLGLAPLEAMASGLPVVAPASGGVLEYASPANAWLTDPLPARFARAVERVLARPELRASRVTQARATAAHLDWRAVTARYFRLYDLIQADSASRQTLSDRPLTNGTNQLSPLLPHRHSADTSVH